ncbi:hypothetical protein FB451DRAFT_1165464 [Mycena latifolia]|nr:hypothetical protein FB451DRAFT_1165464 [Mycena latifolia]
MSSPDTGVSPRQPTLPAAYRWMDVWATSMTESCAFVRARRLSSHQILLRAMMSLQPYIASPERVISACVASGPRPMLGGGNCNTHRKLRHLRIAFAFAEGNASLVSARGGREGDAGNAWDLYRCASRDGHQRRVAVTLGIRARDGAGYTQSGTRENSARRVGHAQAWIGYLLPTYTRVLDSFMLGGTPGLSLPYHLLASS